MSKLAIQTQNIEAELTTLKAELDAAVAVETLTVGEQYTISVGRAETARDITGTLIGQRTLENGSTQFRFSAGEGFDARFYDLPISKVVVNVPEGHVSSATIARNITRLENKLANLATSIAEQEARENLTDGVTYTIQVGVEREPTPAVLLGTGYDDKGTKKFKFFYGSGFDAQIVVITSARVVLEPQVTAEDAAVPSNVDALPSAQESVFG